MHHTFRSTYIVSQECLQTNMERGVITQSYIADGEDYQRHLHCLLVSVTTQQELVSNEQYVILDEGLKSAKDVAVHLLHWLVITYNGKEIAKFH